ncbi:MAG: hypothetical protein R3B48_26060 [Kofleriaceae bacterium]
MTGGADQGGNAEANHALLDDLYDAREDGEPGSEELVRLRRLREVFAELKATQEEPPPAGMALLMAAARQAAEDRRPTGLWARLRAGWTAMLQHPGIAAAAAAVLVVGASGYLMSRGVGESAQSTYSSDHEDGHGASSPARSMEDPSPGTAIPAAAAEAPAEESIRSEDPPAPPPPVLEGKLEKARDSSVEPGERGRAGTASRGAARRSQDEDAKADDAWRAPLEIATDQDQGGLAAPAPTVARQPRAAAKPAQGAPQAPPPRTNSVEESVEESEVERGAPAAGAEDEVEREPNVPSRPSGPSGTLTRSSERWLALARTAAARGNCDAVRLLATRVKAEDPAFYSSRFLKDPALKKCL